MRQTVTIKPVLITTTPNAQILWSGPNNFSSSLEDPLVSEEGVYTLTVTNPANGCTAQASALVLPDLVMPEVTASGGILTCAIPGLALQAGSPNNGVSYAWTGPNNFISGQQNPVVSTGGVYSLVVTGSNGCTSTASATVAVDLSSAELSIQSPEVLTCSSLSVQIQTTISLSGAAMQGLLWSGPNLFSDTTANPMVSAPGLYILTATTTNACTASASVVIDQDISAPGAMAQGGILTCLAASLDLNGGSGTPNVSYTWTGPNNFMSALEDPNVSQEGDYTLTVTGANDCTSTATASVLRDASLPDVSAVSSNNLNCISFNSTLTALSQTSGLSFFWNGPNNFTASTAVTSTQIPGVYQVAATAPNGCVSTATVSVTQDILAPDVSATGAAIDCTSGQAMLSGNSQTNGVNYTWAGPGNFISGEAAPGVSVPGIYTLVVTEWPRPIPG